MKDARSRDSLQRSADTVGPLGPGSAPTPPWPGRA